MTGGLKTRSWPFTLEHPEYKANREVALNDAAFLRMKVDAQKGRSFSNIVAEYRKDIDRQLLPIRIDCFLVV